MNRGLPLDWRLCRRQAALYGIAALTFSTSEILMLGTQAETWYGPVLALAVAYLVWFASGLLLAASAHWVHAAPAQGLWRGALVIAVAATLHGPVNQFMAHTLVSRTRGAKGLDASNLYLLWVGALCGSLFLGYCLLVQRSRSRRGLLARAELERANTEARLREAQTRTLEERLDPALLEQSLGALRATYARDRATGEDLLGALVEVLRLGVPAPHGGAVPRDNDNTGAARAWKNLRERLDALSPG